jgi:Mn2+/Fe2+ NRAMP family transporter
VIIFAACIPIALGVDPLKLTMYSMAITALILPLVVLPFLVLMNDPHYVDEHQNGWLGNWIVFLVIIAAAVIALVAIPLTIVGGQ